MAKKMKTRNGGNTEVRCTNADGGTKARHWFTSADDEGSTRPFCTRCGAENPRWPQSKCAAPVKGGAVCGRSEGKEHDRVKSHEFTTPAAAIARTES